VAIRKNLLTIKQVARILTLMELEPAKNFVDTALDEKLLDKSDSERLIHEHLLSSPSIKKLVVECGLLTEHQAGVLHLHFEKQMAQGLKSQLPITTAPGETRQKEDVATPFTPPQPKFVQRPVVSKAFSSQLPP
jgi:hypothetical protein